MADTYPDAVKREFDRLLRQDKEFIKATIEEAHVAMYQKDYQKAIGLMRPLVKTADENTGFQNSAAVEYYDFRELMEELLYRQQNKPKGEIRKADFPFTNIYLSYGSMLLDVGRLEEANEVLGKALRWNPVNMIVRSAYMETLKRLGRIEEYGRMCTESFQYAFRGLDLARCYRNLGYYLAEKEHYHEALGVFMLSRQFDPENKNTLSEIEYIKNNAGELKEPTAEEMKEYAAEYGFPIGAHEEVLGIAFAYGKHFAGSRSKKAAKYCFQIVYDLTGDGETKELMERLG